MNVSSASSVVTQVQSSAVRKVDTESKVEGKKPDGDNDSDDKVGAAQNSTSNLASTGNVGTNINVVV